MPLHQGVDNLSGLVTDMTLLPHLVYTGLQEGVFRLYFSKGCHLGIFTVQSSMANPRFVDPIFVLCVPACRTVSNWNSSTKFTVPCWTCFIFLSPVVSPLFCYDKDNVDNFSSYLMYFYHHRSPDLSSSRDDDDAGYNSTKADEVHCTWSQLNHWIYWIVS